MIFLDSRVHENEKNGCFLAFYEFVNVCTPFLRIVLPRVLKLLNSGQSETIDHYIIFRGRNSLIILNLPLDTIPLNLGSSRYHKIQNPALHPFGVAGFWVTIDHFKSSFLIGLKEETWFQNITECCLYLTPQKVNGNWGLDSGYSILDPGYWMLVTGYHSTRV